MITNIEVLKRDLITIENIKTFLVDVPLINPHNPKYIKLWTQYTKQCIEGFWGFDSGGWRFMPPTLFYYGNFFKIEHTERLRKMRTFIKPIIRDLDWLIHYSFIEAQGFSGFKDDDEFSCDLALLDNNEIENLRKSIKDLERIRFNDLHTSKGILKKYINPREYLKKLHNQPLGKPLYYNPAKNLIILGARGGGKSYTCAGICTQTLSFDGIKEFTKEVYLNPPTTKVILGAGNTNKSSELVNKITTGLNVLGLDKDLGVWGKSTDADYTPNPFYRNWIGDDKPGNAKNPLRYAYSVESPQGWVEEGSKTSLLHINYSDKKQDGAQAGAGGRSALCLYEEIGLMPNFKDALLSNKAVVSVDAEQFGVQVGIGTSGNIELVQQTRQVFENPGEYDFLEFDNIWEEGSRKIGLFIPAYLTELRFKDENGNTNIEAALQEYEKRRLKEAEKKDPEALYTEKMNYPLIPSDMWISPKGSYFCQLELMEREKELVKNQYYKDLAQPTVLFWDSKQPNGVRAEYSSEVQLLHTSPFDRNISSIDGGVAIYEKPNFIRGEIPKDMYIFTFDPYVSENIDEGGSLGVTLGFLNPKYISEGYNGNLLVCSYIGKHSGGKDAYYEIQEKLLAYYGNPHRGLWYEANRGDSVRGYYTRKNKLHLLALRPNKERGSSTYDRRVLDYGYLVGNQIDKIEMCDDTNDWLLTHTVYNGKKMRVVETLPCLFLVQQLIQFNLKGNFDAVSSLLGYPLALKELEHNIIQEKQKNKRNIAGFLSMNPAIFKNSVTLEKFRKYAGEEIAE